MVSLKVTWAAKFCLVVLFIVSVEQLSAHTVQKGSASYIDTYGQHSTLAVRLAELVEAEEPLQPEDVARLAAAVK